MYYLLLKPPTGLEPATFGLEVQRAIHCAKGAMLQEIKKVHPLWGSNPRPLG